MPILQTWETEQLPGYQPITFDDWLLGLPEEEQQRYWKARARADALRQKAIDEGRMIITLDGYVWKDQASLQVGKKNDDECLDFFTRFNAETGKVKKGVYKEIP